MKILLCICFTYLVCVLKSQEIDTLTFHSNAFNELRSVYIIKPNDFKYKSDSVKFPVIYVLDGQHEWFVNPILSDIKYLQYTHEIPNALVVLIPHNDRQKECGIKSLNVKLPLEDFIINELDNELSKYHPNPFKIIIGHSFSASFSLLAYYNNYNYFNAVIAHTPLDQLENLIIKFEKNNNIDKSNIAISIGGINQGKDYHHRKNYNQLQKEKPNFFNLINIFEANYSAHNAVPIVATSPLLSNIFANYRARYSSIAQVNDEYQLKNLPDSSFQEIEELIHLSKLDKYFYPPEIADINGIASRFYFSGYYQHAIKVYELGIDYYPHYYEFYLSLYELLANTNKTLATQYLLKAEQLLKSIENNWKGKQLILQEIETLKNN